MKGIRSLLFEVEGTKEDSILTFWTGLSSLDKMFSG